MNILLKLRFHNLLLSFLLILNSAFAFTQNREPNTTPPLLIGQGDQLLRVKAGLAVGNPNLVAALKEVVEYADTALEQAIVNVVDEGDLPPSGNPHDYYSYSPYWWPDTENPEGPYIWRDGEVNPDRITSDVSRMEAMVDRVTSLVPAWYFTGNKRYAESAVEQLRAWFLDPKTKMNPNVQFGQKRRGHNYNSPSGVLEAWRMHWVIDCAILLESFPGWTEEDANALRSWFNQFATWMVESPEGIEESMQPNNHGSWYNAQLILYALYGKNFDLARKQLDDMPTRIFSQVFIDGRQPQELIRTRSLNYSIFNARALITVARLGRHLDYDLFAYRSLEGRCIALAVDYMTPFILGEKEWPIKQIRSHSNDSAARLYWDAANGFQDRKYANVLHNLPESPLPSAIVQLLDPLPEGW
ncbi:alginate lyase family protein [Sabulilitoribacter multivorans]|uniref:Alginate lyase family protein n=1 Tax=Flaviramulus multivorans TaxID=1304750 RepID=A0ABS9ILE3_9FLAO|nr:alginate lyase family protein [Flaviramulus multivorans]MCF7561415.1 alginate lyase family protein [Flaviramulus multivorans]